MAYRGLITVDAADNPIECQLTLSDQSGGHEDQTTPSNLFNIKLNDDENRRLEAVVREILMARHAAKGIIPNLIEESKDPESPSRAWTIDRKRKKPKLTISIDGYEPLDGFENHIGCLYHNPNNICPRTKKRNQIYCGHHLRLVSQKYEKNRALKRSRSSIDLDKLDQEVDYAGLE